MSENKRAEILRLLTEAAGQGVTGKELQSTMQSTRKGVNAAMERLRQDGYKIAARIEADRCSRFFLAEHFPGKWTPPPRQPKPEMVEDAARKIRALVNRPQGTCRLDILLTMGRLRRQAARMELARMIAQGEAVEYFKPRARGKPMARIFAGPAPEGWFTKAERAEQKQAKAAQPPKAPKPAKPVKVAKPKPKMVTPIPRSAQPPQPKVLPPAIIPANVKRTIAPAPQFDHRFQVDPRTRVVGGFATLGPGRYLDERRAA